MKEELLGLFVVEEFTISCKDCNSKLAELVVSETNDSRVARGLKPLNSKYKVVDCYKCGSDSFETKIISGSVSICPSKDFFDLDEVDTNINNGIIESILTTRKRQS